MQKVSLRLRSHKNTAHVHVTNTVGTPKYVANKMKSKGLQRLRWFCQVCEKQCRDENGFKCHTASEAHLRQMLVVGEHAGKHISDFSSTFQSEFVSLLSRRCVSSLTFLNILKLFLGLGRSGCGQTKFTRSTLRTKAIST